MKTWAPVDSGEVSAKMLPDGHMGVLGEFSSVNVILSMKTDGHFDTATLLLLCTT